MTGSVALDVVIGLVFIFLLYSLLASVFCEIIATQLGLRARNLHQAVQRMLEDSPVTSEAKFIAFLKHIGASIRSLFLTKEGPSTCVFYHLPVIKYLGRNSYFSKPSYISRNNFSKAVMEIFRKYGGNDDKNDLEKIHHVLNGAFPYELPLLELKRIIDERLRDGETGKPRLLTAIDYTEIRNVLKEKIGKMQVTDIVDPAQKKLFNRVKNVLTSTAWTDKGTKADIYKVDELLNLFGHETRAHLRSLLKDAQNDIERFRSQLEQWFDDTMERATGWYKRKVQVILFLVGFVMAAIFNVSTVRVANILSADEESRDRLVQMANTYLQNYKPATGTRDSLSLEQRLDSLLKVRQQLEQDIHAANAVLGLGWDFPSRLRLYKEDSLRQSRDSILLKDKTMYIKVAIDEKGTERVIIIPNGMSKKDIAHLLERSEEDVFQYLFPFLFKKQEASYIVNVNKSKTTVEIWKGKFFFLNFWGYFLTAIAISLGAPFWFDTLNKLMKLRGSGVKEGPSDKSVEKQSQQPITVNVHTQKPDKEAAG